jgi:hypothetical protein
MDGAAQERAVAQEVKRLVNLSVRRRLRRSSAAQGARHRTSACQPDETGPRWNQHEDGAVHTHLGFPSPRSPSQNTQCSGDRKHEIPVSQRSPNPTSTHLSPPAPGASQILEPVRADDCHVKFAPTLQSIATPDSVSVPSHEDEYQDSFPLGDIREIEMALLAYYLDFVFYDQFPFYKPHTQISGRGWLLSLLMNRGTSYYACLSLSASYQHALLPQDVEAESSRNALSQWYLALAIQDMQQNIDLVVKRASTEIDHSCINLLFGMLQLTFLSVSPQSVQSPSTFTYKS